MCFSYAVNFDREALQSRMLLEDLTLPELGFFFSAFTWPRMPVIHMENNNYKVNYPQWGLIPNWCRDYQQAIELQKMGLNAKGETLLDKPLFKTAVKHGRCLVPAAGFFEWREFNKRKYPYFITPADDSFFLFAGISEHWTNKETGEIIDTFSIVTCPANNLLSMIHNTKKRMPLILDEISLQPWLQNPEQDLLPFVKPFPDIKMKAITVGPLASNNKENRNAPEVQKPHYYPELEQKNLF